MISGSLATLTLPWQKILCCRSQPLLTDLLDIKAYAHYIAFQVAKQNSINTLSQQISNAKKVLAFFKRSASDTARLQEMVQATEWLDRLGKQLKILIPRSVPVTLILVGVCSLSTCCNKPLGLWLRKIMDIGILEDEGKWMHSHQLVALMEDLRLQALEAVPVQGPCSPYSARLLMDALLGAVLFGGHIPPLRLCAVRTLQVRSETWCTCLCVHRK